jgi:hypothetical protein
MVYLTTLCVTEVISHENVGSLVKMYSRVCELNQSDLILGDFPAFALNTERKPQETYFNLAYFGSGILN